GTRGRAESGWAGERQLDSSGGLSVAWSQRAAECGRGRRILRERETRLSRRDELEQAQSEFAPTHPSDSNSLSHFTRIRPQLGSSLILNGASSPTMRFAVAGTQPS